MLYGLLGTASKMIDLGKVAEVMQPRAANIWEILARDAMAPALGREAELPFFFFFWGWISSDVASRPWLSRAGWTRVPGLFWPH